MCEQFLKRQTTLRRVASRRQCRKLGSDRRLMQELERRAQLGQLHLIAQFLRQIVDQRDLAAGRKGALYQCAQPSLSQTFSGRINRRQRLRQGFVGSANVTIFRMNNLQPQWAATYLAVAAQPCAARQPSTLRV